MPRLFCVSLLAFTSSGCGRMPIEDGAELGPLTQIKDSFTSCFLLEAEPALVLFDACFNGSGKAVARTLEDRGQSLSDLTHVFITHGHTDHTGGLEAFPQAAVLGHREDQALSEEEGPDGRGIERVLTDGEVVTVGGVDITPWWVPGHTAGSVVYEVGGVLVMGDVVIAQKDGSLAPPPERYSDDPAQNDASVRELVERLDAAEVSVDWVAPAHSGAVKGMEALRKF